MTMRSLFPNNVKRSTEKGRFFLAAPFRVSKPDFGLVAPAAARPSVVAPAGLRLIAGLAEDGTIAPRFEGDSGLLTAPRADYRCSLRCVRPISTTATTAVATAATTLVVILFRLTARLAPLWRGITAFTEEGLIGCCKGEILSAIAASELQVPSHIKLLGYSRSRLESSCACFIYLLGTLEEMVRKSEQRFGSRAYYCTSRRNPNI
jgi:hypothetical protein